MICTFTKKKKKKKKRLVELNTILNKWKDPSRINLHLLTPVFSQNSSEYFDENSPKASCCTTEVQSPLDPTSHLGRDYQTHVCLDPTQEVESPTWSTPVLPRSTGDPGLPPRKSIDARVIVHPWEVGWGSPSKGPNKQQLQVSCCIHMFHAKIFLSHR